MKSCAQEDIEGGGGGGLTYRLQQTEQIYILSPLLLVSSFNYFKMYAWSVYKHAVVAAFSIYAQHDEDAAKRGG